MTTFHCSLNNDNRTKLLGNIIDLRINDNCSMDIFLYS